MTDTFEPGVPTDAPEVPASGEGDHSPAPAENADAATAEPSTTDAGGEATEGDDRPRGGFQRRIAELTAIRRDAERDRDYWRELAMRQNAPQEPKQDSAPKAPAALPPDIAAAIGPAPRPEDFPAGEFDPAFIRAATKYEIKQEQAQAIVQQRQAQQRQAQQQDQAKLASRVQSIIEEGGKQYADFADVVLREEVPLPQHVVREIAESEKPAAVAYWLGKNPKEAARIADIRSPAALAREVARIEAKIASAPVATPSNAPAPPRPVRGTAAAAPADPSKMSLDQYMRWRDSQG